MPVFKFLQHFENAKSKSFVAPFDNMTDATAFGTAILDGQFEVLEPVSTEGNKAATAYTKVLITVKSIVNGSVAKKGYLNAIVKPTVSESDIQAALTGKTYSNGIETFLIDQVSVSETKAVA